MGYTLTSFYNRFILCRAKRLFALQQLGLLLFVARNALPLHVRLKFLYAELVIFTECLQVTLLQHSNSISPITNRSFLIQKHLGLQH